MLYVTKKSAVSAELVLQYFVFAFSVNLIWILKKFINQNKIF